MDLFDMDGDGDGMGIAEFGMALGLGDEMAQERRDINDLRRWQKEEEKEEEYQYTSTATRPLPGDNRPTSVKTRRKGKDRPVGEFWKYVEASLRGEIDLAWEEFNCANPLGKRG